MAEKLLHGGLPIELFGESVKFGRRFELRKCICERCIVLASVEQEVNSGALLRSQLHRSSSALTVHRNNYV